ncbi:hypothetical protein TNIN_136281 [Trichonephila inaurata madagascariensis]|uniref:Uncharacterized protein n=1 Tax=Trichonephila inaurata madagascariensis TaxID=2747483 RepID=A0A8X6M650_9ARAC|nr:hypothetical protein TNIN_136281 [Trichonephila inaurata madagascariensis]
MFAFSPYFSSPFGALTCPTKASDAVEDVRGTFRHTLNPLFGTQKGVKSCRERPLKLIAEVAYIKSLLFRAVPRDDQRPVLRLSISKIMSSADTDIGNVGRASF